MAPVPLTVRPLLVATALLALLALLGVSCGGESEPARAADSVDSAETAQLNDFCAAVKALDDTDGTTEDSIVLEAFDEMKRTAPDEVRDDVVLLSDTLIVNDYPAGADDSMTAAPVEVSAAAGDRLGAYVNENCYFEPDEPG